MKTLKLIVPYGNDIESAIAEVVLPEAIERMRGKLNAVRNVTVDTSDQARERGNIIEIDRPVEFGDAEEMAGSDRSGVDSDIVTGKEQLVLDKYFYKQFTMNETEILGSRSGFVMPSALAAAIDSVSRSLEKYVLSAYKQVPHYAGAIDVDQDHTHHSFIAADKALHDNGFVEDDRIALISQRMKTQLLRTMKLENQDAATRATGNLGDHYGFAINQVSYAPSHTAGTASANAGLTVDATAGTKVITVTGLANGETIVDGDLLELASGDVYTASALATGDGASPIAVSVYQVVKNTVSGEALDVKGSHDINLGLHKSAITVAFRPLEQYSAQDGFAVNMIDPVSQVPLTIRHWVENGGRTKRWAVECLAGMRYFDLGRAVRIGPENAGA